MSEQNSPQLRTRSTDNISVSDYCSLTNSRESPVSLSPVPFYHSPPRSCSPVYDGINVYTSKNYDIHIKAIRGEWHRDASIELQSFFVYSFHFG